MELTHAPETARNYDSHIRILLMLQTVKSECMTFAFQTHHCLLLICSEYPYKVLEFTAYPSVQLINSIQNSWPF